MDTLVAKYPIAKASLQQFAGVVSFAGEVAANLFVAGGSALTLRIGSYARQQDPNTGALFESFVPNRVDERDEVLLQMVCDRDPACGITDVNPFETNLWQLSHVGQPATIEQAIGANFAVIPKVTAVPAGYRAVPFVSDQAMFLIRKTISSIFALAVTRGAPDVGLMFGKSDPVATEIMVARVRKVKRTVQEKKRDKLGNVIFKEAVGPGGEPIFDPVFDRAGRPVFDPRTGEIRKQRRLEYETEPVEREDEQLYNEKQMVMRTPVYLFVAMNAVTDQEAFMGLATSEAAYDPTWMLKDVLAGACAAKHPYHSIGGKP